MFGINGEACFKDMTISVSMARDMRAHPFKTLALSLNLLRRQFQTWLDSR
jgi:hypothetical protein